MKFGNSVRCKRQRLTDFWWNPGKKQNRLEMVASGVLHAAAFALMFVMRRSTK